MKKVLKYTAVLGGVLVGVLAGLSILAVALAEDDDYETWARRQGLDDYYA